MTNNTDIVVQKIIAKAVEFNIVVSPSSIMSFVAEYFNSAGFEAMAYTQKERGRIARYVHDTMREMQRKEKLSTSDNCYGCHFWNVKLCRRFPEYVKHDDDDWCGEFKRKQVEEKIA